TSEEHAAVARELRRLHVVEDVAWSDLAVVVRRQGAHVGNLLRALDDAQVPRVVPERGLSLGTAPSTHPYVLALRWLAAGGPERDELVDAFRVLWEELPCSRRLVEGAGLEDADDRRDLDTVVTFANAVAEASEGGDTGVQGFLEALDAGEHGPGWTAGDRVGPDAVAVLTAHGTVGLEFDTVIVA